MRRREAGVRVDRAAERVARVLEAPELHEHQTHAVPRHRAGRLLGQRLLVLLQRRAELAALEGEQAQVEPRREQRPVARRAPGGTPRSPRRASPRGPAPRRGCSRRAGRRSRCRPRARTRRSPRPAGRPGGGRRPARSTAWASRGSRGPAPRTARARRRAPARSRCTSAIACRLRRRSSPASSARPVLPQRLLVVALLPQREAQIEMRERGTRRPAAGPAPAARQRRVRPHDSAPFCPAASQPASSNRSSARFACARASVGLSAMARLVASRAASCWPRSP